MDGQRATRSYFASDWAREREVYERMRSLGDGKTATLRRQAERSWRELHAPRVCFLVRTVLGLGVSVGAVAVLVELAE